MDEQSRQFIRAMEAFVRAGSLGDSDEKGGCLFIRVLPKYLIHACRACLANGAVFDSAFVSQGGDGPAGKEFNVYYLFQAAAIHRMVVIVSMGHAFDALSEYVNAALWDERKIQDLTGLRLAGIPDSRPLLFHPESGFPPVHPVGGMPFKHPKSNAYPMAGTGAEGEFEVAVGPVHAGIIEPGHFRFHVMGEKINKMETRMFYLHRGIEKKAEGQQAAAILPLIEQISGDEAVANSVAYCSAVEQALGMTVPKRAESIRAIHMELERIYSHLADLGGMATDVGFTLPASRFAVLREDAMRLNAAISGSRFLHGQIAVGGVGADLDGAKTEMIAGTLKKMTHSLWQLERMVFTSSTFLDRAFQAGTVSKGTARDLSLVGPAARACGVHSDLRRMLPYSAYAQMTVNEPVEKEGGDVLARFRVKLAEVNESARLILHLIAHMPQSAVHEKAAAPRKHAGAALGVGWAESARGGCTMLVEIAPNGAIKRLALRSASFRNWRALEKAVEGNIVPDFPLINKSFNLSYAGTDM
ncbi:MAG: NADH-quinone oxidoreductase subunit C [Candidatus Micrarchaeia archaeon]|jgi:Ni,Fe-hydrogenase III large subunit/Ni,Fe-hydrogenase III component G